MLKERVGRQDVVVWLDDGSGNLWGRGDSERKLGFAAVVNRETLEKKGSKARASSTASCMEDHEALETSTVIGKLANAIENKVDNFLAKKLN